MPSFDAAIRWNDGYATGYADGIKAGKEQWRVSPELWLTETHAAAYSEGYTAGVAAEADHCGAVPCPHSPLGYFPQWECADCCAARAIALRTAPPAEA